MSAYCVGCGRPLPCTKREHTEVERERLSVAAERDRARAERRDFERRTGVYR